METPRYECWQRTLIDLLVQDKWELSRVKPYPPLIQWYNKGITPEEAHRLINTHHTLEDKRNHKGANTNRKPKQYDALPKYPRLAKGTNPK